MGKLRRKEEQRERQEEEKVIQQQRIDEEVAKLTQIESAATATKGEMVIANAVISTYSKRIAALSTTEEDPSPSPQPLTSISIINQYRKASEDALGPCPQ